MSLVEGKPDNDILACDTDACKERAHAIEKYGQFNANPCEDFDKFACGKYHIPRRSRFASIQIDAKQLLKQQVYKVLASGLAKNKTDNDMDSVAYLKQAYQECTKEKIGQYVNWQSVLMNLKQARTFEEALAIVSALGESIVVNVDVRPDLHKSRENILWLSPGKLILPAEILSKAKRRSKDEMANEMVKKYEQFIHDSWNAFYKPFDDQINIKGIIDYEKKLASSLVKNATYNLKDSVTIDTVDNLDAKLSQYFKFSDFIRHLVEKTVSVVDMSKIKKIAVENLEYFKYLSSVPNEKIYKDHLKTRLLDSFQYLIHTGIATSKQEAELKPFEDVSLPARCMEAIMKSAPMILGNVYYDEAKPISENDLDKVDQIVYRLTNTLNDIIDEIDWISDDDKEVLQEKIDGVKVQMGYPTWIKYKYKLDKSVYLPILAKDNAFDAIADMQRDAITKKIDSIGQKVDRDRWQVSPAAIDVSYDHSSNTMTIPAAILQAPFFDSNFPDYLNYAGLGVEIAKNFLKAVGPTGIEFSVDGEMERAVSGDFANKYNEKSKCYVNAYNKIYYEDYNLAINGEKTLEENIAENEGLKLAHKVFEKKHKKEVKLSSEKLDTMSNNELFFVSYGNNRCHAIKPNALYVKVASDKAAPLSDQTFVALSNYPKFAEAMDCKNGKYVPDQQEVCSIWI